MGGDWRELAQATAIGLIFAFLLAKLISTVLSFQKDNLRIVRTEDSSNKIAPENPPENQPRPDDDDDDEEDDGEDDEWEGIESTELDELFSAATAFVAATAADRSRKSVSSDTALMLYGFYKIATEGPCTAPQPSALKISARAKWTAWKNLGTMTPEEAMQKYITTVTELYPTWTAGCSLSSSRQGEVDANASSGTASKSTMGPVFSSFIHEEENNKQVELDPLHVSAREGDINALRARLEDGFSVNTTDSEGRTPLHWAVDRGQAEIVDILLNRNADVNAKDNEGQTPLHYAFLCDRPAIADELIRRGANTAARDNDGQAPRDL